MKTMALILAFIVTFACGILFERGQYRIDTVENPFGAPTIEQQTVLNGLQWKIYEGKDD